MLQTYPVRQPPQGRRRSPEVPVFPGAVQRGRIVIDVIVDVLAVCMGGNKESEVALCPAHRRFIADTVSLLGGDLPRLEMWQPIIIMQQAL